MDIQIPEISIVLDELAEIKKSLQEKQDITAFWFNDQQCWELKGGMSLNTYRTNRFYQCKGGIPDAFVGGRKVWNRESVIEWLSITDDQLEEYHRKYKTGAKKRK